MIDWLQRLFGAPAGSGKQHPLEEALPLPLVDPAAPREQPEPVYPRVLAIVHNPQMPMYQRKISAVYGWNDPDKLAHGYIEDVRAISYGYANYRIVERIEVDGFPVKKDGYRYDPASFDAAWKQRQFYQPDAVDYHALIKEFDVIEKLDDGKIDEVWLLGFPYCGYYESIMAGPGAFWCNAPPLAGTEHASRRFVIMGFNYERGVGEMLENLGHRAESMLSRVFKDVPAEANLYEKFIRYDRKYPGQAECGNVHFAPNSERDYDWGNPRFVPSRCDTWLNFPDLSGKPRMVSCKDWGGGDIREHHRWWFRHFPHIRGETAGISWNWWEYVIDPNRVPV